jgi:hypothetical protein
MTVVLGCFILFGAGSIVAGIHTAAIVASSASPQASDFISARASQASAAMRFEPESPPLALPVLNPRGERLPTRVVARGPVSVPRTAPVPPIYMSGAPQQ